LTLCECISHAVHHLLSWLDGTMMSIGQSSLKQYSFTDISNIICALQTVWLVISLYM